MPETSASATAEAIRVLIVDDEAIARDNLQHVLARDGHEAVTAANGVEAVAALRAEPFDVVLTDLRMEGADGMEVLEAARQCSPPPEVILMTGYGSIQSAVEAMQRGAYHYLAKPLKLDETRAIVARAGEKARLSREVADLRRQLRELSGRSLIIGSSPKVQRLNETIAQIAPTDSTVLILGETGTGKELAARSIHNLSRRAERRFLAVNCGAFSEELLANELFGHEKGAFTGAVGLKKGLLEAASGGTLFLDEIGELSLPMQVRLLRVIQERVFLRLGGTKEIPADIRVVAATNRNLKLEVEAGRFRADLFYRLNVICLQLPSLAERQEDIPLLCAHFIEKFAARAGRRIRRVSSEAMRLLRAYPFPGNIRELENIMERAVILAESDVITPDSLPPDLAPQGFQVRRAGADRLPTLEENELEYIRWVLDEVGGNRTRAAEILAIDRASLWRKLKRAEEQGE